MSGAVRDYHLESRVSNENYKLELAIGELVGLGVGRQEILEHVGETLDDADVAVDETASSAEFIRLGFGPAGSMHFRVSVGSDWDAAAEILAAGPPGYNGFDRDKVAAALRELWPTLSSVEFGREYSPVIYAVVPCFPHQGNGSPLAWSEPFAEAERRAAAVGFLDAMSGLDASEVSWRGMPQGGTVPEGWYTGPSSIPDGVRMHGLRAWWD